MLIVSSKIKKKQPSTSNRTHVNSFYSSFFVRQSMLLLLFLFIIAIIKILSVQFSIHWSILVKKQRSRHGEDEAPPIFRLFQRSILFEI